MDTASEFAGLQTMNANAGLHTEGGKPVVLLPKAKFRAGGKSVEMDLLLYPHQQGGYVTRLFFEQRLEGAGISQNWTEHTVLGRKWWTPSYQGVQPEQPWTSMVGAHLRAVA